MRREKKDSKFNKINIIKKHISKKKYAFFT